MKATRDGHGVRGTRVWFCCIRDSSIMFHSGEENFLARAVNIIEGRTAICEAYIKASFSTDGYLLSM